MKFYFFKSTNSKDEISTINVFTNNIHKAYNLACKAFMKNNCSGYPILLTI